MYVGRIAFSCYTRRSVTWRRISSTGDDTKRKLLVSVSGRECFSFHKILLSGGEDVGRPVVRAR